MNEFIQHLCQLDMFRTSSVHHQERFLQAVYIWYTKSANTACKKNAPDDGPMRSETCRDNISAE